MGIPLFVISYADYSMSTRIAIVVTVLLRLLYIIGLAFLLIIVCLYFFIKLIVHIVNPREQIDEESQRSSRIQQLKDVIQGKGRQPSIKDSKEQCVICLEDFNQDSQKLVAELNCSQKHVFHVECINSWIEKNDECPMCRQKINN